MPMVTEFELHRALECNELRVFYQPIVSAKRRVLVGFEALVRWQHPEHGLLPPADFIPLAENSGLIVPMGRWIMTQACSDMNAWHEQFPVSRKVAIAVNVAALQWASNDFVVEVQRALDDSGLLPSHVKLEITESSLVADPDKAADAIRVLKKSGVHVCIDDFGVGYSSLGYLQAFEVNTLKVDRCFIERLGADHHASEIVRAIVSLAHGLGLEIVAEGVETETQCKHVQDLQCEYAQGYLFARPMPPAAVEQYLARTAEDLRQAENVSATGPDNTETLGLCTTQPCGAFTHVPTLAVLTGPCAGRVVELRGSELVIGRSPDASLSITDNTLSRLHARIVRDSDGHVCLVDLGSRNGTYCNAQRIERCPLESGDRIQVGQSVVEVWLQG